MQSENEGVECFNPMNPINPVKNKFVNLVGPKQG